MESTIDCIYIVDVIYLHDNKHFQSYVIYIFVYSGVTLTYNYQNYKVRIWSVFITGHLSVIPDTTTNPPTYTETGYTEL